MCVCVCVGTSGLPSLWDTFQNQLASTLHCYGLIKLVNKEEHRGEGKEVEGER